MDATELLSAVDSAVDRSAKEAESLLADLVAIRSVNPTFPGVDPTAYAGGEAQVNRLLRERLGALGLSTHHVEAAESRPNLVAIYQGRGGGRSLALNGHVDTVAPTRDGGQHSGDPWTPRIEGRLMYGLGATDMKAGHAAMWLLVKALADCDVTLVGDLHLHSVVGEETMSHQLGTTAVLDSGFGVDAAIVLEGTAPPGTAPPSGLPAISNTAAGNLLFELSVPGKAAHWSSRWQAIRAGGTGDEVGVNAIDKGFSIYRAVRQLEEEWAFTKRHDQFPPGCFTIHPGLLEASAGVAAAAYFPDHATFTYLASFPPGERATDVADEIERQVRTASQLDAWLREHPVQLNWLASWPPAYTDPASELVETVARARADLAVAEHRPPPTDGVGPLAAQTDASFYEEKGIPAVVCGPGDLRFAHSPGERVDLDLIPLTAKLLARAVIDWCGVD